MADSNKVLQGALCAARTRTLAGLGAALKAAGFEQAPEASPAYNSYSLPYGRGHLELGYNRRVVKVFLWRQGDVIPASALPAPEDLVVFLLPDSAPALRTGSDALPQGTQELLSAPAPEKALEGGAAVRLVPHFVAGPPGPEPPCAIARVFGAPQNVETRPYRSPFTDRLLAERHASKAWGALGVSFPDRGLSAAVAMQHIRHAGPARTMCFYPGSGELALALLEEGTSAVLAVEPNPALAAGLGLEAAGKELYVQEEDPMAFVGAAYRGGPKIKDPLVAAFPYVAPEALAGPAYPGGPYPDGWRYPEMPPPMQPGKTIRVAGEVMLGHSVRALAEGVVATFLVPPAFGRSAGAGLVRNAVVGCAEVLDYTARRGHCILTLRRRAEDLSISEGLPRPLGTSSPHVRWVGHIPVFVEDRMLPGERAGESGRPTLGSEFSDVKGPSSKEGADIARRAAQPTPMEEGWVRLHKEDCYVPLGLQKVPYAPAGSIVVARAHAGGVLLAAVTDEAVALGQMDYGIVPRGETPERRSANLGRIMGALQWEGAARWLEAVSSSSVVTESVLRAVPMEEQ